MRHPLTPLRRVTAVDVVIPVHDEQDLLPACLDALDECIAATPVPVTVTVVLDACSDGSEAVAAGRARLVRSHARSVGIARACGFAAVSRASSSSPGPAHPDLRTAPGAPTPATLPGRRWYATTDADSRVPRTWLADQLALAHAGADVVAGLVELADRADRSPATRLHQLRVTTPGPGTNTSTAPTSACPPTPTTDSAASTSSPATRPSCSSAARSAPAWRWRGPPTPRSSPRPGAPPARPAASRPTEPRRIADARRPGTVSRSYG